MDMDKSTRNIEDVVDELPMRHILCDSCQHHEQDLDGGWYCGVPNSSIAYRCAMADPRNDLPLTALNHRTGSSEPLCLGYFAKQNAMPHLKHY
jgi:hypothetical protein